MKALLSLFLLAFLAQAADVQPANAEAQRAVEKGLQSVARQVAASPGVEVIPVGLLLPTGEVGKKSGWVEQFAPVPSVTVVPDFRQKALKDFQTRFAGLLTGRYIDAYLIIYEKDNQLHIISQEKDGPEKSFAAAFSSRLEIANLKVTDFKAK